MPNGLIMTVLASNKINYNDRDDIALRDTLKEIKSTLEASWSCIMPTTPKDELLESFTGDKEYFFEAIDSLIKDADKAIDEETNQLKASKLWQMHLGAYFPDGEDKDVDKQANSLAAIATSILDKRAKTGRDGVIQESQGVNHKPHRNYGG